MSTLYKTFEKSAAPESPIEKAKRELAAAKKTTADVIAEKAKPIVGTVAGAPGKAVAGAGSAIGDAITGGEDLRRGVVDKLNPFTPDTDKLRAAEDALTKAYREDNLTRTLNRAQDKDSLLSKLDASTSKALGLGSPRLTTPTDYVTKAPPKPGVDAALPKPVAAPDTYVELSRKHVVPKTAPSSAGKNWLVPGLGAGLGGLLGYGASKMMNDDEDEAGITPEEKARRQSANTRRALLLASLGAGAGGAGGYMLA